MIENELTFLTTPTKLSVIKISPLELPHNPCGLANVASNAGLSSPEYPNCPFIPANRDIAPVVLFTTAIQETKQSAIYTSAVV